MCFLHYLLSGHLKILISSLSCITVHIYCGASSPVSNTGPLCICVWRYQYLKKKKKNWKATLFTKNQKSTSNISQRDSLRLLLDPMRALAIKMCLKFKLTSGTSKKKSQHRKHASARLSSLELPLLILSHVRNTGSYKNSYAMLAKCPVISVPRFHQGVIHHPLKDNGSFELLCSIFPDLHEKMPSNQWW